MLFYALLKVLVNWQIIVELPQQSPKLRQLLAFVETVVHLVIELQYLDENTHEVTEDSDAEHKDEGAKGSLSVRLRVEVAEANSAQRGERIVDN